MYIKFLPNEYVIRYKKGKVVAEGLGLAFYYFEKNTSACAIPVSNNDADFIFEEQTKDYQTVSVQGQFTYRILDYKKIAGAMDFTVNLRTKQFHNNPLSKLSKRIVNIAEVVVKNCIGGLELTEAIKAGQELAGMVLSELREADELRDLGITVTGFSILKIAANSETVRALEAKTREEILQQSDDALYERRNAAIEQERKVKENELNSEIKLEEKKKQIKETEIATRRMTLEKENELARMAAENEAEQEQIRIDNETKMARIRVESQAEREKIKIEGETLLARIRAESEAEQETIRLNAELELEKKRRELADMKFENAKKEAEAEAYRVGAIMEAYNKLNPEVMIALATVNMDPRQMLAQAAGKFAENCGKIGTLNVTPDLLQMLTEKIAGSEKTAG